MSSIDNRIVEMQFNNKEFERNMAQSMKSLDAFKSSLNFDSAISGFDNLDKASKKLNFSHIAESVGSITVHFNAIEVAFNTMVSRITNAAIDTGKKIFNALTVDGIRSGFQEYETQINATQTILANTSSAGTTLEEVTDALDELNLYADKTIYNFTEMTRNIGTFTAAGVDLDTSVSAIKGIANLAAVSGSTSEQASRAMYQLSQALASGVVNLQDWNSVVNAGMGGKVFQDALVETAATMGVIVDTSNGFRASMDRTGGQGGWLTSDILLKTLQKFTGDMTEAELAAQGYSQAQIEAILKMGETANDAATKVKTFSQLIDTAKESVQSGWTQSWEYVIGDFEEAKEVLTAVSQEFEAMIGPSTEARNSALKFWHDSPYGRETFIKSIGNVWKAIKTAIEPVKSAFDEMFPNNLKFRLISLTTSFRKFSEKIQLSEPATEKIYEISKKIFSVLKSGIEIIINVGKVIKALTSETGEMYLAEEKVSSSLIVVYRWLSILKNTFKNTLKNIIEFGKNVANLSGVQRLISDLKDLAKGFNLLVNEVLSKFGIQLSKMDLFGATDQNARTVLETIDLLANGLSEFIENLPEYTNTVKKFFSSFKLDDTVTENVDKVTDTINKAMASAFGGSKEKKDISNSAEKVSKNGLKDFLDAAKSIDWSQARSITSLIGLLVSLISLTRLASSSEKFLSTLQKLPLGVGEFLDAMAASFRNITKLTKSIKQLLQAKALTQLTMALVALAMSIAYLSTIPKDDLYRAVVVFGMIAIILSAIDSLNISVNKTSKTVNNLKLNIQLIGKAFSAALLLASAAAAIFAVVFSIKALVNIGDFDAISMGLGTLALILTELGTFIFILSNVNPFGIVSMLSTTGMILAVAGAIYIISGAMINIGRLDESSWKRANTTITTIMVIFGSIIVGIFAIAAFAKNSSAGMIKGAQALTKIAGSMILIASAITMLTVPILILGLISSINPEAVTTGFTIVIGMLAAVSAMMIALAYVGSHTSSSSLSAIGKTFLTLSAALAIMAIPIGVLASIKNDAGQLGKATSSLLISIGVIGVILMAMTALTAKFNVDVNLYDKITNAIVKFSASLLIISAAFAIMSLTGIDWNNIWQMVVLIVAVVGSLGALTAILSMNNNSASVLSAFGVALIGLGVAFAGFGAGLYLIAGALPGLTDSLPNFSKALGALFDMMEDHIGIVTVITLITIALSVLLSFIIVKFSPVITTALEFIGGLLSGFTETFSALPTKTKAIVVAGILALIGALSAMTPDMLEAVSQAITKVFTFAAVLSGAVVKGLVALLIVIIYELSETLIDSAPILGNAIRELAFSLLLVIMEVLRPIDDVVYEYLGAAFMSIFEYLGNWWGHISDFLKGVGKTFKKIMKGDWTEAAKTAKETATNLFNFDDLKWSNVDFSGNLEWSKKDREKYWDGVYDYARYVMDEGSKTKDAMINASNDFSDASEALLGASEKAKATSTQTASNYKDANTTLEGMLGADDWMKSIGSHAGNTMDELDGAFTQGFRDIFDNIDAMDPECYDVSSDLFNQTTDAAEFNVPMWYNTTDEAMDDITENLSSSEYDFYNIGRNQVSGINKGFNEKWPFYYNNVMSCFKRLNNSIESYEKINSPSKVWAGFGKFMMLGLAEGADNYSGTAIDSFIDTMMRISDTVDTDIETTPTITPVLDMTNLQNGISQIPSMFNRQSYRLAGINTRLIDETKAYKDKISEPSVYDDINVVESLKGLRSDMSNLADSFENMQIVMDNGALVGAITPGIDRALGVRSVRKGRGN